MSDNDPIIKTLHTTVLCYLSTLLAVGECLGDACPPVGGPYRTKLSRLKSRLAFDTSSASVEESSQIAAAELKDYAVKASAYLESYSEGHRRAIAPMEGMLRHLSQRLEFHGARLREVGGQSASERQSAAWHSCVESMSYDTLSLIARMREELNLATSLIAEAATTDTVTGLMNRREIERTS